MTVPYKKFFSLRHYIVVLRRQSLHVQHIAAALFAGGVTLLLGVAILYFEYGFWHDRYDSREQETITVHEEPDPIIEVRSPKDMLTSFAKEAVVRLRDIKVTKPDLLEGKDVYTREASPVAP